MNEKIMTGFTDAAQDVLKAMLDLETEVEAPENPESSVAKNKVIVAVGLIGDISGETCFCFPEKTALEIVKNMCGMEIEKVDDFVTSALGEISNIICGNAATGLSQQQIACDILPPKISVKDGKTPYENEESSQMINSTIHTEAGNMGVAIKIEE